MATFKGYAAKLYFGIEATGIDWVLVDIVKDVTVSQELTQSEATTRLHGGAKGYIPTLGDLKFEFQMNADGENESFALLQLLHENRTPAYFAALDGEMGVDGDGPLIYGHVFSFNQSQTLDGVNVVDVVVAPSAMMNEDDEFFPNTWWSESDFA